MMLHAIHESSKHKIIFKILKDRQTDRGTIKQYALNFSMQGHKKYS